MHHALLWYQIAYTDQACRTSHHASVPTLIAYSIQTSFLNLILSIPCITTVINIIPRNALAICKMGYNLSICIIISPTCFSNFLPFLGRT